MNEEHDLTFEKLEISKRLREAELQLARIASHLESEQGTIDRMLKPLSEQTSALREMTVAHARILHGNGDKGLVLKVNNLENASNLLIWLVGILCTVSVGTIVTASWKLILK